jgi:hypothetical protein
MRLAALAPALVLACGPALACAPPSAEFFGPVDRYGHKVLGDTPEWSGLRLGELTVTLPEDRIFEDIAPRLIDVGNDCRFEAVVVETGATDGAQLAVYVEAQGVLTKTAATPPVGRAFRWLSPVGSGDFDGDGQLDLALVRMPHILGGLEVWTLAPGGLTRLAAQEGFANHRVGDAFIVGGVRDCGKGDEMVLPDFRWSRLFAVTVSDGDVVARQIADSADAAAIDAAMACK